MDVAARGDIGQFMDLCVKAKEWHRLAAKVHEAEHRHAGFPGSRHEDSGWSNDTRSRCANVSHSTTNAFRKPDEVCNTYQLGSPWLCP